MKVGDDRVAKKEKKKACQPLPKKSNLSYMSVPIAHPTLTTSGLRLHNTPPMNMGDVRDILPTESVEYIAGDDAHDRLGGDPQFWFI